MEPTYQQPFGEQSIESAEIKNFQSAEFGNITSAIERTLKMNKWGTILLWCVLLAAGNPAFILLPIIGGVLKVMARSKGVVNLEYDFDAEKEEEHDRRVGAWIILAEGAKEMWYIESIRWSWTALDWRRSPPRWARMGSSIPPITGGVKVSTAVVPKAP